MTVWAVGYSRSAPPSHVRQKGVPRTLYALLPGAGMGLRTSDDELSMSER